MGAGTTSGVILESTDSLEEVVAKVSAYAAEHPDKKTIFGASYSAFIFNEKGPRKELLDEIVPDRPGYLMDHTLHTAWVNSKAYEVAGITKDTQSPAGGEYMKNDKGELSGWVKGGAAHLPILVKTEAIAAYTIGGATMLGIENEVGTIEVGKKANLILLSQNLFEIDPGEIPRTKVLGTMFDGQIVHDVLYDLGDSELVDLEEVGKGATGPCSRHADD
jgi:predicted amidohydrolase YtcJ